MNPAGGIRFLKRRQDAIPHSEAEGGCWPFEGRGLPEYNPVIEDPWIGTEWRNGKRRYSRNECAAKRHEPERASSEFHIILPHRPRGRLWPATWFPSHGSQEAICLNLH